MSCNIIHDNRNLYENLIKFMNSILKVVFFLIINFSVAQNIITVEVLDSQTSNPVSFCTIEFMGTSRGIVADYNGQFRLPLNKLNGISTLKISSIGYETLIININKLSPDKLNILKIKPKVEQLSTIILKASRKKKKKLSAFQIVKKAVNSIKSNLASKPHSSIGYYRDYQIYNNGEYYNLNEGIVEQFDYGISSHKLTDVKNQSALYLFKPNLNYKSDITLASAYGTKNKYIQNANIINFGGNELSILNAHNPIRIFNQSSFSYVYKLEKEFLSNHNFSKGKTIINDDETLISIQFIDKKSEIPLNHSIQGEIVISLLDFAIHNFKYVIHNNDKSSPVLNVDIEYRRHKDNKMYLNYMSFNNKFYVKDNNVFKEKQIVYNKTKNRFEIEFNRDTNLETLKKNNFKILYKNKKISTSKLIIIDEKNIVLDVAKIEPELDSISNEKSKHLKIDIKRVRDFNNRLIYKRINKPAYQFREFFVQEVFEDKKLDSQIKYIDKFKPLSKSPINSLNNIDDYIINSPLMKRRLF